MYFSTDFKCPPIIKIIYKILYLFKDTNGNGKSGPQVTICFKRKEDSLDQDSLVIFCAQGFIYRR